MTRLKRRALFGLLVAALCALALLGVLLQALGMTTRTTTPTAAWRATSDKDKRANRSGRALVSHVV